MSDDHHRIQGGDARRRFDAILRKLGLPAEDDGSFRDDTLRVLETLTDVVLRLAGDEISDVERDVYDLSSDGAAVEKVARALYDSFEGGRVRAYETIRKAGGKLTVALPWDDLAEDVREGWRERSIDLLRLIAR